MARVKHLPHSHSDHCPLLLELEEEKLKGLGLRPFRFEAAWMTSPDFERVLTDEWQGEEALPTALKELAIKLHAWNATTFGNIFRRKCRNELRLGGVQRELAVRVTNHLIQIKRELQEERNLILRQEEILWFQKSRNVWLRSGDGNTRFFHTSTLIKRRRKRIDALQDEAGS